MLSDIPSLTLHALLTSYQSTGLPVFIVQKRLLLTLYHSLSLLKAHPPLPIGLCIKLELHNWVEKGPEPPCLGMNPLDLAQLLHPSLHPRVIGASHGHVFAHIKSNLYLRVQIKSHFLHCSPSPLGRRPSFDSCSRIGNSHVYSIKHCVPGTLLITRGDILMKISMISALLKLTGQWGRKQK